VKENMNTKIFIFEILIIIFLLNSSFGCAGTDNRYEFGNDLENKSIIMTIIDLNETDFNETNGYRVVFLNLTIENIQIEEIRICRGNFYLVMENEKRYDPNYFDTNIFGEGPWDGKKIEPGQTIETYLGFNVYSKSNPDYLYYSRGDIESSIDIEIISNDSSDDPNVLNPYSLSTLSENTVATSIVVSAIVVIIFSVLILVGTEIGKYSLFSSIAPLYSKRRKKRDENYELIKWSVHEYIYGHPGQSYNAIKRKLKLSNGTLGYHINSLEREGIVTSERDGILKRFYPAGGSAEKGKEVVELTNVQQGILDAIVSKPGLSQKEIQKNLGITQQRVNYNIKLMADARLIRVERDGKRTRCFIINDN
jgi:DNA-binding MarR family transcriptional regulator